MSHVFNCFSSLFILKSGGSLLFALQALTVSAYSVRLQSCFHVTSLNSGYANGHQTFNSSGTLWAVAASKGMNVVNTSQNCFQSSITITVQKQSNITASYSCIDTTSQINDVINGQMGVIINGTNHTHGWNNRSSYSYSGIVPAKGTIKFYVQCGSNDGLRMGMNYSLTVN